MDAYNIGVQNRLQQAVTPQTQKLPDWLNTDTLTKQKEQLKTDLGVAKTDATTQLDAALAARGISRSGAYGAGVANIENNYTRALASGNLGYDTAYNDKVNNYYMALMKGTSGGGGPSGEINPAGGSGYGLTADKVMAPQYTGRAAGEPMYATNQTRYRVM